MSIRFVQALSADCPLCALDRLGVTKHYHGSCGFGVYSSLQHVNIVFISKFFCCFIESQPGDFIDFVIRYKSARKQFGEPIMRVLYSSLDFVGLRWQWNPKFNGKPGFFSNFSNCCTEDVFARFNFSFWKGPIVAVIPVHK